MSETHDPWKAVGLELLKLKDTRTIEALLRVINEAQAAEAAQHQQEMARLRALMLSDEDRIVELLAERDRLKAAFLELHATVKGECPSLLDPDRGGSDVLWALCAAALTPHQGQSTDGETR